MQDVPPPSYPPQPGSAYPPPEYYQQKRRASGYASLKYGFIAGAIIAVITILIFLVFLIPGGIGAAIYNAFPQTIPGIYFSLASIIVSFVVALLNAPVYFCMGLFASRRTGKLETAMLACLWALLCFFIADIFTFIISFFMYPPLGTVSAMSLLLVDEGISLLIDLLLALIFGFSAAILGGTIGKSHAR